MTTRSGRVTVASSLSTLAVCFPSTEAASLVYLRNMTSVGSRQRFFKCELLTVSSQTKEMAAPVLISIVSCCPSTSNVVFNGLLLGV